MTEPPSPGSRRKCRHDRLETPRSVLPERNAVPPGRRPDDLVDCVEAGPYVPRPRSGPLETSSHRRHHGAGHQAVPTPERTMSPVRHKNIALVGKAAIREHTGVTWNHSSDDRMASVSGAVTHKPARIGAFCRWTSFATNHRLFSRTSVGRASGEIFRMAEEQDRKMQAGHNTSCPNWTEWP